jgi:hypothetical protein
MERVQGIDSSSLLPSIRLVLVAWWKVSRVVRISPLLSP